MECYGRFRNVGLQVLKIRQLYTTVYWLYTKFANELQIRHHLEINHGLGTNSVFSQTLVRSTSSWTRKANPRSNSRTHQARSRIVLYCSSTPNLAELGKVYAGDMIS